jgi:hypothetical protein
MAGGAVGLLRHPWYGAVRAERPFTLLPRMPGQDLGRRTGGRVMGERSYWEAVEAGDPSTVADAEERFGARRRHDAVAEVPGPLLNRLVELTPADQREQLIDEIVRRRPREMEQR